MPSSFLSLHAYALHLVFQTLSRLTCHCHAIFFSVSSCLRAASRFSDSLPSHMPLPCHLLFCLFMLTRCISFFRLSPVSHAIAMPSSFLSLHAYALHLVFQTLSP